MFSRGLQAALCAPHPPKVYVLKFPATISDETFVLRAAEGRSWLTRSSGRRESSLFSLVIERLRGALVGEFALFIDCRAYILSRIYLFACVCIYSFIYFVLFFIFLCISVYLTAFFLSASLYSAALSSYMNL